MARTSWAGAIVALWALGAAPVGAVEIPATIPQVVLPAPELSNYAAALVNPGLNARLSGPGPITAFVPLNHSPDPHWEGPTWPVRPEEAAQAARGLVVDGNWTPERLRAQSRRTDRVVLSTDTGGSLVVAPTGTGRLIVVDRNGNTARIVGPARPAGNGGVIVLDRPLATR